MDNLKLDSFLGIKFGTSVSDAKEKIQARPDSVLDESNSEENMLVYHGVAFAGRETLFLMLHFFEGKFCKGVVCIQPKLEVEAISLYEEIKSELNSKYYKTQKDYENYKSPYEKDDGYTESAISLGKATFSCFWDFKNDTNFEDYISIRITEELNIVISYENGYLMDLLVTKTKANNSLDY